MSFKLLQHRPQVGAFLEQQLPVQLENVLQVAAEYAPHELVTYGMPGSCGHLQHRTGFPQYRPMGDGTPIVKIQHHETTP
ncbi:Uncharacterised protein [Escherichia coli]|nr:Uncharacterised protein [Escherichia coli]